MKTILQTLSNEKAVKEQKKFLIAGLICSIVGLLILWPAAIGGVAFSGRSLLLTWHKANNSAKNIVWIRVANILILLISIVSLLGQL